SLQQLRAYTSFKDLDWQSVALEIQRLQEEMRLLEEGSDVLKTLKAQLDCAASALRDCEMQLDASTKEHARLEERRDQATSQLEAANCELASLSEQRRASLFPLLEDMRTQALGEHRLTVESCDNRQHDLRQWLQGQIDNENRKIAGILDASVAAAAEYRQMLAALRSDGLPRFEARFKELLNENTIREVAQF